jgi:HD-GYP domain-containing protein (c-di-GMP phosphodiesterase class II)
MTVKARLTTFADTSILRKLTILYFLVSIMPLSVLYYFYLQIQEQGHIEITENWFALLMLFIVSGVAVGYVAMRSVAFKIVKLTEASTVAVKSIRGLEKLNLSSDEDGNEVSLLLKSFNEITSHLEENVRELEEAKRTLHTVLARVGEGMASMENIDSFLNLILETLTDALQAKTGVLLLFDKQKKDLFVKTSYGENVNSGKHMRLSCQGGIFAPVFHSKAPEIFEKMPSGETLPLLKAPMLCAPLILHDDIIGVVAVCEKKSGDNFDRDEKNLLGNLSLQTAVAIENSRLSADAEKIYFETISALALAVEAKDPHSRGHSERVANLCEKVAVAMKLSQEDIALLRDAAKLHDLGKIGIPDSVLKKAGSLTEQEKKMMRQHAEIGEGIIKPIRSLRALSTVVRNHHEKIDGSGYPDGLKGDEVSLLVRILEAVDIFDALASDRPYRKAFTAKKAIEELRRLKDKMDQRVIDVMASVVL